MIIIIIIIIIEIKDSIKKLETIRNLICLLPVPNRDTLQVLLNLLDKVRANSSSSNLNEANDEAKNSSGNKMDSFNLAMVFGPNILRQVNNSSISSSNVINNTSRNMTNSKLNDMGFDKYKLIDDIDSVISVTKYLIENQKKIFHVTLKLYFFSFSFF